ncbi:MAG: hypothetical protein ABL921_02720 [Pirellula sp.]
MSQQPVGYSGKSLAQKLGIIEGMRVIVKNAPPDYEQLLSPLPNDVTFASRISKNTPWVHIFCVEKSDLRKQLESLREKIDVQGVVWVSWPKKSAKVSTDITEDTIRVVALPLGFVDVKVCAVSEIWSGLKLVIRKELR